MSHTNVDLETLGLTPGSVIRSIGAVVFDPFTGALGAEFYRNITRESCEAAGLTVNPDTVAWWDQPENAEAQAHLAVDQVPLVQALGEFTLWWTQNECGEFWANDPNFDETLLAAAYAAVGLDHPWHYRAPRSCRTIYDLAGVAPNRDAGVHHNALIDAKNQAIAVHDAYAKLGLAVRPACHAEPEPAWQWYAGGGKDPDIYSVIADTRERAIDAARRDYGWMPEGFTICEARKASVAQFLPAGEQIIDMICDTADGEGAYGEDAAGDNIIGDASAASADLDAALRDWIARHPTLFGAPYLFGETRNQEFFEGEAESPTTGAEIEA